MDGNIILLGLVAWVLVALFVLILMKMAGDQDRAARREQQRMIPYQDGTVELVRVRRAGPTPPAWRGFVYADSIARR